jgi:hypothetical protein
LSYKNKGVMEPTSISVLKGTSQKRTNVFIHSNPDPMGRSLRGGIILIRHVSVDHLTVYGGGSLPSGRWGASLTFPFEFGSKEQPSGLGKRPLRLVFGTFFFSFYLLLWFWETNCKDG